MHIVMPTLGSAGDTLPFVALGRALQPGEEATVRVMYSARPKTGLYLDENRMAAIHAKVEDFPVQAYVGLLESVDQAAVGCLV